MSTQQNMVIVKRFIDDVCNARKLELADKLFSSNHRYHDPSVPGIPDGPEGQKQLVTPYQSAFPDAHWQVDEMFTSGDRVITRWTGKGTHKQELAGNPAIPATGKKVAVNGIWIHRLTSGKIVESWAVWDTLGMLQQLGVVPRAEQRVSA